MKFGFEHKKSKWPIEYFSRKGYIRSSFSLFLYRLNLLYFVSRKCANMIHWGYSMAIKNRCPLAYNRCPHLNRALFLKTYSIKKRNLYSIDRFGIDAS